MADTPLRAALRHIRTLTDEQSVTSAADGQLLDRFARRREEAAFAALDEAARADGLRYGNLTGNRKRHGFFQISWAEEPAQGKDGTPALYDENRAWQAALKRLDLPSPQGRPDAADDAGISSVPTYWLLDPNGKIVSKVYDPDELAAPLADRLK